MQKNSDAQVRMWVKNWEGDEYGCTLYFVETAFYRVGLRKFQGRGMRLDKLQDEYEVQRRMRVVGFLDTLFHQANRGGLVYCMRSSSIVLCLYLEQSR